MTSNHSESKTAPVQPVYNKVGENLYRLESTGGYYALIKRGDKQFRRSLKTKDRKLADRRLSELCKKLDRLSLAVDANVAFPDLAKGWLETIQHTLKGSTVKRMEGCVKNIEPFFSDVQVRNITPGHCERWVVQRGRKFAPQTFAHELGTMKGVFRYAVGKGYPLDNPAEAIKRKKIKAAEIQVPTREQFEKLVAAIRESDAGQFQSAGDTAGKARPGADLVELLAYSGCRVSEATSMRWSDIDFDKNVFTVRFTKNGKARTVPMTPSLRVHLSRLHGEENPKPNDLISPIKSARKWLETACRRLGLPIFTHHEFRHFFATTCIESSVDIPTISRWLGHSDGGALAMRVYGHLRDEHSRQQAQRVCFSSSKATPENVVSIDAPNAAAQLVSQCASRGLVWSAPSRIFG